MKKIHEILTDIYDLSWSNLNILECGASNSGDETEFFKNNNNCWFVEANIEDFGNLKLLHENVMNVALSDNNGTIKFIITSHPGNSSCDYSHEHLTELKSYGATFKEVEVECITYSTLLQRLDLTFDLVVLDIEGHEKKVLETLKNMDYKKLPNIIVIECGYDWEDRKNILKELGYKIDCFYFNNCYLSKNNVSIFENFTKKYNEEWKYFTWCGKLIYSNNLMDDTSL